MIYSIIVAEKAKKDIIDIFEYITFELYAPQAAANLINKLETAIKSLETMPFRFIKYANKNPKLKDIRMMSVDNFLVFYCPNKEDGIVNVFRVIYSGRDIDEVLDN